MPLITRYVVKMKNGGYMKQEFEGSLESIRISSVDHPIDADLLKSKDVAIRCVNEILSGNSSILVLFDEENPPVEVDELEIECRKTYIFN